MLLATAATAALLHDEAGRTVAVRTVAPPPAPGGEDTATTAEAAPPTTAEPVAATTPSTTPPPPTTTGPTPRPAAPTGGTGTGTGTGTGSFGPRSPGSVSFPPDPARTSWSATQNGITLSLTVDRQDAPAGEPVNFTLEATSDELCCSLSLLFGDGSGTSRDTAELCGGGSGWPPTPADPASHVYNRAGRWEFLLSGSTGRCGTADHSYATIYGWVYIGPGVSAAQGPAQPTIRGAWAKSPDGQDAWGLVKVGGSARDEDGFIDRFSIDWGDGSTSIAPGDGIGCRPSPGGWPAASQAWYHPTGDSGPAAHLYAAPGAYTVVVTVHSTGCDGSLEQTATWSDVWDTEGPNP